MRTLFAGEASWKRMLYPVSLEPLKVHEANIPLTRTMNVISAICGFGKQTRLMAHFYSIEPLASPAYSCQQKKLRLQAQLKQQ